VTPWRLIQPGLGQDIWTEAMEGTKVDNIMFGLKIYIFIPNKYIYSK